MQNLAHHGARTCTRRQCADVHTVKDTVLTGTYRYLQGVHKGIYTGPVPGVTNVHINPEKREENTEKQTCDQKDF